MARAVWHDQPDYYTTATLPRFWTESHDAEVSAGSGYGGSVPATSALTGATEDGYVISLATGVDSSVEFGLGHRLNVVAYPAAEKILLGILATGGRTVDDLHLCTTIRPDGKVSVWRGAMATLLATSVDVLTTEQQLAVGMTGVLSPADGAVEVWVNRDPIIRINGVPTVALDPERWGGIYFGLAPDLFISHLYAQAGYGDLRPGYVVRVLRPTVAVYTGYAPNVGDVEDPTSIPACIDDENPDDDATHIVATALDQRYAVEHEPVTTDDVSILGARTVALVKNVSGPSPSFTPFVRHDDGRHDFGDWRSVVSTEWRMVDRWYQRSPFTDLPWTPEGLASASWGGQTDL